MREAASMFGLCFNQSIAVSASGLGAMVMVFFRSSRPLHRFRPIRRFLCEDFNPIWGIDCKHYFFVTNIDDRHYNLAIDYDGFALGTDESFNDCEPPVFLGMFNSPMFLFHGNDRAFLPDTHQNLLVLHLLVHSWR